MRGRACIVALLVAGTLAGCSAEGEGESRTEFTVYLSAPLSGPESGYGRGVRDGARLAFEERSGSVGDTEIRVLDDARAGGRWSPVSAGENARRATADSASVAYLGELASGATRTSLPITNEARLLQISPASTATDLVAAFPGSDEVPEHVQPSGERSFGRVIPDDEAQAGAGAAWARELGARTVLAVTDGSRFGDTMVDEFTEEAEREGITVRRGRADADLVYYGGAARGDAVEALRRTEAPLIATDALLDDSAFLSSLGPRESRVRITSSAEDPSQLPRPEGPRFARRYEREFDRSPDRYAAYGYEAAALALELVERTAEQGSTRTAMIDELFATRRRDSVLGTYSIDELGNTTLDRLAGYRVRDGRPVFATPLRAP